MFNKIALILIAAVLTGCASTPYSTISNKYTARVVEGPVVSTRVRPPDGTNEVRVADTATTAIAANNVGNASVMKGLVVFDVISILTEDKGPRKFYHPMEMYTVSDDKTGELFEVPKADMYVFGVDMAEVGDRLRVIVSKSKKVTVYNLTKNPELEEKTR